jgi:hypothetical protein
MTNFDKLAAQLQNLPAGLVSNDAESNIASLLEDCWHELEGAEVSKMEDRKLLRDDGPQEMTWSPPKLSFIIERHGGMVQGSTRAEKQKWNLDIEKKTVYQSIVGFRQVHPRASTLNVKLIAEEVCKAVQEGPHSKSELTVSGKLVWKGDGHLVIKHGKIIPNEGFQQTIAGRRKRFRTDLQRELDALGWKLMKTGPSLTFKRK